MKHTKRIVACLLALLVLAMSAPVMAAENTGSITVENATPGKTYTLYKLFDATYGEGTAAYYLKADSEWYALVAAATDLFKLETLAGQPDTYLVTKQGDDNKIIEWFHSTEVREAVAGFTAVAEKTAAAADGKVSTLKFEDLPYGYYFVTSTLGAVVSVTNANADVEIIDKNQQPGWGGEGGKFIKNEAGKWVASNTQAIGGTNEYKVTVKEALNYAGAQKVQQYILRDQHGSAIRPDFSTVKVKINGVEVKGGWITSDSEHANESDRTVDPDEAGKVNFDNCNWYILDSTDNDGLFLIYIKWQDEDSNFRYEAPADIEVTYQATLLSNASIGEEAVNNYNTAVAEWKTADGTFSDTAKTVTTYTYALALYKTDSKTNAPLAGAIFKLIDKKTGATVSLYRTKSDSSVYYLQSEETAAMADREEDPVTEFTTPADGVVLIKGLQGGEYQLVETQAPGGYNLLRQPVDVTLSKENSTNYQKRVNCVQEDIKNSSGTELPATGGKGTTLFISLGALAVLGAGLFLVVNKRMSKEAL